MNYFFSALLILVFNIFAFGQAIAKIDDFGAVPDDSESDTIAVQAAVDHVLEKGGGTVVFGPGLYIIDGRVNIVPRFVGYNLTLEGTGGATIRIGAGEGIIVFYAANLNQLNFRDLTFLGRNVAAAHPDFIDSGYLIFANYVLALDVSRCNFFGLAVRQSEVEGTGALIFAGITEAKIRDSNFNGSWAPYPNGSLIEAVNTNGLIVSNSRFFDYANFQGEYFDKTTSFVGAWIRALNTEDFNSSYQKRILVEDSFFDEGAAVGIDAVRIPNLMVSGVRISVSGTSPGRGIRLNQVGYAEVKQSVFGLATSPRPAIEVIDVQGLKVSSIRFSEAVYFLLNNGVQSAKLEFCPQCGAVVQSPRKPSKSGGTFR
jgi:hypothetical protein